MAASGVWARWQLYLAISAARRIASHCASFFPNTSRILNINRKAGCWWKQSVDEWSNLTTGANAVRWNDGNDDDDDDDDDADEYNVESQSYLSRICCVAYILIYIYWYNIVFVCIILIITNQRRQSGLKSGGRGSNHRKFPISSPKNFQFSRKISDFPDKKFQ